MFHNQDDVYQNFIKDSKEYLKTRYDLLKLELLEKMSKILALIVMIFIALVLILTALAYFSLALVVWMENFFGSLLPGFLIVGGFFLLLLIVIYCLRTKLFLNPLIGVLSGILFEEKREEDNDEQD
ncbi:MAG: phage holin family protein [Bacteroidales bacterium]|nr:phage holin family protein [Bacteroidales bacterium]